MMTKDISGGEAKRNYTIEFFRFLFCAVIFVLHFRGYGKFESAHGAFSGGYLSVEFFFIVSGYFLMERTYRDRSEASPAKKALRFLGSRYRRLYPMYLISLVLLIVCRAMINPSFQVLSTIKKGFPEFFALQIFWCPHIINLHLWFVSANLWASFLVYYLIFKDKERFLYLIEPLALLTFFGVTFRRYGHIDMTDAPVLWLGGVRAFAEIGLGCVIYEAVRALDTAHVRLKKWFCSLLEILVLTAILLIMYRTRRDYKDYIVVLLQALFVFLIAIRGGVMSRALDHRVFALPGRLSYLMYLNQALIMALLPRIVKLSFWAEMLLGIAVLFAVAWIESALMQLFKKTRFRLADLIADREAP